MQDCGFCCFTLHNFLSSAKSSCWQTETKQVGRFFSVKHFFQICAKLHKAEGHFWRLGDGIKQQTWEKRFKGFVLFARRFSRVEKVDGFIYLVVYLSIFWCCYLFLANHWPPGPRGRNTVNGKAKRHKTAHRRRRGEKRVGHAALLRTK